MSRLNEIKKVRYKLKNSLVYVELTKEQVSFLCEWAEKGLVAISKTETTSCRYCIGIESHGIATVKTVTDEYGCELGAYDTPYNFCPNCGRKIRED